MLGFEPVISGIQSVPLYHLRHKHGTLITISLQFVKVIFPSLSLDINETTAKEEKEPTRKKGTVQFKSIPRLQKSFQRMEKKRKKAEAEFFSSYVSNFDNLKLF